MDEATRKSDYLEAGGTLIVLRRTAAGEDELFVVLSDDGRVTAFNGHVDLGTGIRTALAQIVAEELDVAFARVTMVLGSTGLAPNQGATIASDTIQVTAIPLRQAAAQARQYLLGRAAEILGADAADLRVEDGIVSTDRGGENRRISYGDLLKDQKVRLVLSGDVPLKAVEDYRVVGQPVARVDIPDKVTGAATYVHDVRIPGMVHGRMVRPPYAGIDGGDFVGSSLISVDEGSVAHIPGLIAVVVIGDFIGVVAEREEAAIRAAQELKAVWRQGPTLPDLNHPEQALRANPSRPRRLLDKGDVDAALASAAKRMPRTYVWPYQMHGSIGASCSVADYRDDGLTLWSGTQNPHILRGDLGKLLGLAEDRIEIVRMEAAGCYGRNCADDVGGDAALLSRAVGRPVRVQLTREEEHLWEPKGTAQLMDVDGGLNADGTVAGYDFQTRYPSNGAPLLALLLTGVVAPEPAIFEMGDRTSIPPYDYDNMRVTVHDMPPIVRASWLRGVSALPNTFAHESYIDELAAEAGVDPVEFRLRYLKDQRAVELVQAVAERAGWQPHTTPGTMGGEGDFVFGRGFAYALYVHSKFPGYGAAWSAWVADVAVNKVTGEVSVTRVTVGQDSGLMINPAGVTHQVHGNVIQSISRTLKEQVTFDDKTVTSREWGTYPIITFPDVPPIDVLLMPRPTDPPLGSGESASVPSAAAIANAIFDATGVRFRELPFTADRIRAGLNPPTQPPTTARPKRSLLNLLAGASAAVVAIAATAMPWRPAIAPIPRPDASVYSAATIERGRLLAALGDCAVCHTAPGGTPNAGGLALATPFGTVYSTNITPDAATGIGAWSYPAFERAMRQGIHRDGRHLYPAFPYTAFTKTSDADLQALYAYLMAQEPVSAVAPATKLAFPFNLRPLLAGWNALFLRTGPIPADATHSPEWNRGAYLVEGLGHCAACHSPRNLLGAEKTGSRHLAGGMAEGWEAPALTRLSHAPIPWTEADLFTYLRTGHSPVHGVAAGPMGPVVSELAHLPDSDIRAMATYLASFNEPITEADQQAKRAALETQSRRTVAAGSIGARIYDGACAVCHEGSAPVLFGVRPSLTVNSNLHSATPDNLIHVILDGIQQPAHPDLGYMPAFDRSLDDAQIAELLKYLRERFAADKPPWQGLEADVARIRAGP